MTRTMRYARVYSDASGAAVFEDVETAFDSVDAFLEFSERSPVSTIYFARGAPGRTRPQAPERRPGWVICLTGTCEITASGQTRTLRPGDVMLFEDIDGSGHSSFTPDGYTVAKIPL